MTAAEVDQTLAQADTQAREWRRALRRWLRFSLLVPLGLFAVGAWQLTSARAEIFWAGVLAIAVNLIGGAISLRAYLSLSDLLDD